MNTETFKNLLGQTSKPLLVDFYASWCAPCKVLAAELEKVEAEAGEKLAIVKVDIDQNIPLALEHQIRGVPTLVLFHQNQEIWRHSGLLKAREILDTLRRVGKPLGI